MGYTTDFTGEFDILPPLSDDHRKYLAQFAEIRHMKRDIRDLLKRPDPLREAVGLPLGIEGEFYVGQLSKYDSQGSILGGPPDPSILDVNQEPKTQPGLWCQWIPDGEGCHLVWDQGEKFYDYVEWLTYLIENFLNPWGYSLAGEVYWQGEDSEDQGKISITSPSNTIEVYTGSVSYSLSSIIPTTR